MSENDLNFGDKVILTDTALNSLFRDNISVPLYGTINSTIKTDKITKLITIKSNDNISSGPLDPGWVKKGFPNEDFWYKVASVFNSSVLQNGNSNEVRRKHPELFERYSKLVDKYLKSNFEEKSKSSSVRKLEDKNDITRGYLSRELSKYFKGEELEQKIIESKNLLVQLLEHIDSDYEGDDILLLCSYIVTSYEDDDINKDIRQPLNKEDRFIFTLALEFAYTVLSDSKNDRDTHKLEYDFFKKYPFKMNIEVVRNAINTSIDRFNKFYSNGRSY